MANVIKEAHLVCADIGSNNNKFLNLWLYDDGRIESEFGRIGVTSTKVFIGEHGEAAFDRKVAAKKKGKKDKKTGERVSVYTEARVVASGAAPVIKAVGNSDLHSIARSQIQFTKPELQKLIDRLIRANIHKITSSTQIQYNAATGLFTTPLGVVTPDGITEARDHLVTIKTLLKKKSDPQFIQAVNQFLRIVPQNMGMRLNIDALFPDDISVSKQNDLLDAMESSYQATNPTPIKKTQEKVFDVSLDILDDQKERDRIKKKYIDTRKDAHVCKHLRVKEIYSVCIKSTHEAFETYGKQIGNIKELWHGSSNANLLSILKTGLQISPPATARIAGKMFGNGAYFASDSTKSLNYSAGYWSGTHQKEVFMFLANVALGKYYVPAGSYERLPKAGYQSTWAQGRKSGVINDEFVIYDARQHDLTYLIEFH